MLWICGTANLQLIEQVEIDFKQMYVQRKDGSSDTVCTCFRRRHDRKDRIFYTAQEDTELQMTRVYSHTSQIGRY